MAIIQINNQPPAHSKLFTYVHLEWTTGFKEFHTSCVNLTQVLRRLYVLSCQYYTTVLKYYRSRIIKYEVGNQERLKFPVQNWGKAYLFLSLILPPSRSASPRPVQPIWPRTLEWSCMMKDFGWIMDLLLTEGSCKLLLLWSLLKAVVLNVCFKGVDKQLQTGLSLGISGSL